VAETGLVSRMWRATKLQPNLYEEVEADKAATNQAAAAVVIVSIATGLGAGLGTITSGGTFTAVWNLFVGAAASLVAWLVLALFVYLVGVSILKGEETKSDWGEVLRTMGFANSPRFFKIFAFLPVVGAAIYLIAAIWSLIATIIAIRAALDFSTLRAILTAIIGVILYNLLIWAITHLVGGVPLLGSWPVVP
jgi:hypothetical protein